MRGMGRCRRPPCLAVGSVDAVVDVPGLVEVLNPRALVLAGNPASELFSQVEQLGGFGAAGPLASASAASCAPDGSRALVVSAGPQPALLRRADGTVERWSSHGPALGCLERSSRSLAKVELMTGDALVLHAAGVSGPNASSSSGRLDRRLAAMVPLELGGAGTARKLLDARTEPATSVVLCAVRGSVGANRGVPGEEVRIGSGKGELRDVARSRHELSRWLERQAVRTETIERALLVVSELATNAVAAASDRAELRVSIARGAVVLADDGGSWHAESGLSPAPDGGHGLRVAVRCAGNCTSRPVAPGPSSEPGSPPDPGDERPAPTVGASIHRSFPIAIVNRACRCRASAAAHRQGHGHRFARRTSRRSHPAACGSGQRPRDGIRPRRWARPSARRCPSRRC